MPLLGLKLWQLAAGAAGLLAVITAIFLAGHSAGEKAEQKRTDPKIAAICQAAGSTWADTKAPRKKWGAPCLAAVKALDAFKTDALHASAKVIQDHAKDQEQKTQTDVAVAKRDDQAVGIAKQHMEAEDAAVQNDRVGGSWFAGLNQLGGLRDAETAGADGALRKGGDQPAR